MSDIWVYAIYYPDGSPLCVVNNLDTVAGLPDGTKVFLIIDLEDDSLYGSMAIPVIDGRPQHSHQRYDDKGQYYLW